MMNHTFTQQIQSLIAEQNHLRVFECCQQHIADYPNDDYAWEYLMDSSLNLSRPYAAQHAAHQLLVRNPQHAYAYYGLGVASEMLRELEAALHYFQTAHSLAPRTQFHIAVLYVQQQLASTPAEKWRILRAYDALIYRQAHNKQARINRASLANQLGLYQLASDDLQYIINQNSSLSKKAQFNLALIKLRHAEFAEGWALFEQRQRSPIPSLPIWQGENIGNAPLLCTTEQGYGDNIQFVRYAIAAKQLGFNVVTLNQTALHDLLAYNLQRWQIPSIPDHPTPHITGVSHQISMMSLPHYLAPHIGSQPFEIQNYIHAQPDFLQQWAFRLPEKRKKRIGFVFSGSPQHRNDASRSLSIQQFAPLFAANAEFHCLQKDMRPEELAICQSYANVFIWQEQLHNFSDTAALIAHMDLVISVDTSVAHLAGAMGVPTWILLAFSPDFRWQLERDDSPWYASVQLFRQPENLRWDSVIEKIGQLLMSR